MFKKAAAAAFTAAATVLALRWRQAAACSARGATGCGDGDGGSGGSSGDDADGAVVRTPTAADLKPMRLCRELVQRVPLPVHSNFLACCVMAYRTSAGKRRFVTGVNAEVPAVGGSICSERAAMLKLRELDCARLECVYITTSAQMVITSGMLCREFMSEVGQPSLRIVLFNDTEFHVHTLGELYPLPHLYRRVSGRDVRAVAAATFARQPPLSAAEWSSATLPEATAALVARGAASDLYEATLQAARRPTVCDSLYPLHYAAGVLFADGSTAVAKETLEQEYGCSVHASDKLIPAVDAAAARPAVFLLVDAEGVLHAPGAVVRSFYAEAGLADTVCVAMTAAGTLAVTTIAALTPGTQWWCQAVCPPHACMSPLGCARAR